MNNGRKANQSTKLRINDIEDNELRAELEHLYEGYRVQRELDVENQRLAQVASLRSKIQQAQSQISMLNLLEKAGTAFSEVAQEPIWFVYKKDGEIILESPFTEKDMRNTVRVHKANLDRQIEQLSEEEGGDDLYESGND